MMQQNNIQSDLFTQIVDLNILKFKSNSLIDNVKETNPINTSYYQYDDNTYAILEKNIIKTQYHQENRFKLYIYGIICCIKLKNLPMSQYTLILNGHNAMTGKFINDECIFDFRQHQSNILKKSIMEARCLDEPEIDDRDNYLNFNRIDVSNISFPKTLNFNYNHKIDMELTGYFKTNEEWLYTTKNIDIYPHPKNNLILSINHPTDCIDILLLPQYNNIEGDILLYIEDKLYKTLKATNAKLYQRIKFEDPDLKYQAAQNNYLSEFINKNTLNFSMIYDARFVLINCEIGEIHQYFYNIHRYPERYIMFSC